LLKTENELDNSVAKIWPFEVLPGTFFQERRPVVMTDG